MVPPDGPVDPVFGTAILAVRFRPLKAGLLTDRAQGRAARLPRYNMHRDNPPPNSRISALFQPICHDPALHGGAPGAIFRGDFQTRPK